MMHNKTNRKPYPLLLTGLVIVLGYTFAWQLTRHTEWTVDLRVENGGILKWYVDSGEGFSESEGGYSGVPGGVRTSVTVNLPTGVGHSLRLDPVDSNGEIVLDQVRWSEPWPGGSGRLPREQARWENVGERQEREDGTLLMVPEVGSSDVYGVWDFYPGHSVWWWRGLRLAFALVCGGVVFVLGYRWNRWVLGKMSADRDTAENPPFLS